MVFGAGELVVFGVALVLGDAEGIGLGLGFGAAPAANARQQVSAAVQEMRWILFFIGQVGWLECSL